MSAVWCSPAARVNLPHRGRLSTEGEAIVSARDPPLGQGPESTSVALVDDHELFRRGLRVILEEEGLEVVGEASTGEDAIDLVAMEVPDVILMDISLPGIS